MRAHERASDGEIAQSIEPWTESRSARAPSKPSPRIRSQLGSRAPRALARADVWSGPQSVSPVDLVIALDLSPSTEGPARGRLLSTLAALLEAAPAGSRVRALAFAARALPLIAAPMEPAQVELAPFGRAIAEAELGSATRFEAVWQPVQPWFAKRARGALRPLIVLVGDGGLTEGEAKPFAQARSAGVEVAAINLAQRAASKPCARACRAQAACDGRRCGSRARRARTRSRRRCGSA